MIKIVSVDSFSECHSLNEYVHNRSSSSLVDLHWIGITDATQLPQWYVLRKRTPIQHELLVPIPRETQGSLWSSTSSYWHKCVFCINIIFPGSVESRTFEVNKVTNTNKPRPYICESVVSISNGRQVRKRACHPTDWTSSDSRKQSCLS